MYSMYIDDVRNPPPGDWESGTMLVTGSIPGVKEHSVWYRWGY